MNKWLQIKNNYSVRNIKLSLKPLKKIIKFKRKTNLMRLTALRGDSHFMRYGPGKIELSKIKLKKQNY